MLVVPSDFQLVEEKILSGRGQELRTFRRRPSGGRLAVVNDSGIVEIAAAKKVSDNHPLLLVSSITWALSGSWFVALHPLSRPIRVVAVALLAYELVPVHPWMCSLSASVHPVRALTRGAMPDTPPLGCLQPFAPAADSPTRCEAYRSVLDYLRQATSPQTLVANVLNRCPYESLNGPAGRLSPFRVESGICWPSWVQIDLDPEFARDLLNATDAVVVWEPR